MPRRHTGLVVGKDFRPPDGAEPLDWCFLTVALSDDERVTVRIHRNQVPRADVGDVVAFRSPRHSRQSVTRVNRLGSDPSLLPPVRRTVGD